MGGLVKDATQFSDPLNHIGGPEMAKQVARHWEEASQRHGMPVDAQVWIDMKDEFRSTWPANIAFKAAEMQDREKANHYLRRLREATAAEHQFIHRREVQSVLAQEVGLDHERLILMFFGFQPYPRFVELFERLAASELQAREITADDASILAFVRKYGKVAAREVAEVFSLKMSETRERLDRLASEGELGKQIAGNGWFFLAPELSSR